MFIKQNNCKEVFKQEPPKEKKPKLMAVCELCFGRVKPSKLKSARVCKNGTYMILSICGDCREKNKHDITIYG